MDDHNTTSERCQWTQRQVGGRADRRRDGQIAEDSAARFLEQRGLAVLARNFRCRGGEIDLVCRDGESLVFVEVRLRRNQDYGGAAASIGVAKQRRVVLAARHYLIARGESLASDCACRFDCVLLDGQTLTWIRDAFAAD